MDVVATDENQAANGQVVIVLCGLIGSGKSTFANALQREFPEFKRCNQDELGRRRDVENAVNSALSEGLSVCVDRTNIDQGQRRTWIEIARRYTNTEVWGVQMDTPYELCRERLAERTDHPTITTPEKALEVLSRFSRDFVPIDASEGFNRIRRILPHHASDFTREELGNILASIRSSSLYDSPLPTPAPTVVPPYHSARGYYPYRGRGGRGYTDTRYQAPNWRTPGPNLPASSPSVHNDNPWVSDQSRGGWRGRGDVNRGRGYSRPYRSAQWRGRGQTHDHRGDQTSDRGELNSGADDLRSNYRPQPQI